MAVSLERHSGCEGRNMRFLHSSCKANMMSVGLWVLQCSVVDLRDANCCIRIAKSQNGARPIPVLNRVTNTVRGLLPATTGNHDVIDWLHISLSKG